MQHERPDTSPFARRRQLGELSAVVNSRHGSAYLAEAYTRLAQHLRSVQMGEQQHGHDEQRQSDEHGRRDEALNGCQA